MPHSTRQLVILVGGKGTRLGELSKDCPKPLMKIDETHVFLDFLLQGAIRQGFTHVLMIAGHLGDQVVERYAHREIDGAFVDVVVEPEPMGTGGALAFARDHLADRFVLMNGDTIFDINIRALDAALIEEPDLAGVIALRNIDDVSRYGATELAANGRIRHFHEKGASGASGAGLINGGIYAMRKSVLDLIVSDVPVSLEMDVFPILAEAGQLGGVASTGYFLDIGIPSTLRQAQAELPRRGRPVLFLDRDGVLNVDAGYTGRVADWHWQAGAIEAVRAANDKGIAVVVVTNQAGVARGYYGEAEVRLLHDHVQQMLHLQGAFVDAFYHCPEHPEAVDEAYKVPRPLGRKPMPTMLQRAIRQRQLDVQHALLVGDQPSDLEAARALNIPALHFTAGRLDDMLFASPEWQRLAAAAGDAENGDA